MKVIAKRGNSFLAVEDSAQKGDPDLMGLIIGDVVARESPVQSVLARGYWEAASGNADELLKGKPVIPWVRNT